ncbi:MAG: PAS domain S-box protein [Mesorhizobium sp.]|nr:MAG: PAS domain S-box protein [Mesorhizobium sp.]
MENELSRVVDALPGLVWTALPDGHADFLNSRWLEYTGLGSEEAKGKGWLAAIHSDDMPHLLEHWETIVASGEAGEFEARMRRFDGAYRWFHFQASPLRDPTGRVIRWCGINRDIEDRRRADEAVRVLEGRYRAIVDGLPAIVTLLSTDGHVEHANRHMLEYLGTTSEEMRDRAVGQAFHPDDRPEVLKRWSHSAETGQPYDFEARLRRADGVYRWFHTSGFPLRDSEGRIFLWYFLQTDIEDRKRAEALLFGEKQLLEMVARGDSRSAVLEALCRFVERTASDCYCSVVLADSSGKRVEHGAAPSLPSTFINSIIGRPINLEAGPCGMATYLNEQIISVDLTSETRWPTWCPMALKHGLQACWSTPISSADGKALGAFAIYHKDPKAPTSLLQDLIKQFTHIASIAVERVQNDAALKRSEALLAQAQRISLTGSFGCYVATDEHFWSGETFNIFGYEASANISFKLILERVHPEDRPSIEQAIESAANGLGCDCECRLLMPDGTLKHVHFVAHGTRDHSGRVECIGAVQDMTAYRRSEEALGRARSELAHVAKVTSLGELTASIAHEVNQPLSGIITNAGTCLRMLAADPPNVDGARETARRTIRDGNRAADVVARLRALFAKGNTVADTVDLNEATREVIALLLSDLQRGRVVVHTELAGDLPAITGDRVQLQQVILNLFLNASDAMGGVEDRPRRLRIRTERAEDDHVCLSVQDAGVGFEPENAERLFDAFYTTKPQGMGIGLSVSRSIVESHQGRMWAVPNEGPGATFSFSIPCRPARPIGVNSVSAIRPAAETDAQHIVRTL